MKVKRIVSNVAASDVEKASAFYKEVLGLKVLMDLGWIRTYGSGSKMTRSVCCQGEDLVLLSRIYRLKWMTLKRLWQESKERASLSKYGPKTEPWGVRRFYVRDPFGKLINILQHE